MGKATKKLKNLIEKKRKQALAELNHFEPEIMAMDDKVIYTVGGNEMTGEDAKKLHLALKVKYGGELR